MGKTFGLSAVAGGLIAWNWMRLEQGPRLSQIIVLGLLAIVPALFRSVPARVAAAVVVFLIAAGSAFRLNASVHYPGRLLARFGNGFLDFYDYKVPFKGQALPNMHGTIVLAAFAFTFAAALAIAERRARPAALALLVGAGWPATLLVGHELVRGAAILIGLLVLIIGLSERPRPVGFAAVAVAAVTLVGASASASPVLAKHGFLNWQNWNFRTHPAKPVPVSYVWDSYYRGFTFPRKKTVVFRIAAPKGPHYWRAAVLDAIIDGRWLENVTPDQPGGEDALLSDPLLPARAQARSHWIHQEVTVGAISDRHLVAISTPVSYGDLTKLPPIAFGPGGVGFAANDLHAGERYTVSSYAPEPTPAQLARSTPDYPSAIADDGTGLDIEPGVSVPPFGTPGRVATVRQFLELLDGEHPYLPLFLTAERIAGGARSPYAATVALESWFRTGGGFSYDQHPPVSRGIPPLVDFVTRTHSGYCQHFAGAMALMLRYLGIPSRAVAGFSSGHYDHGVWTVTDHDAHEWVEVWFRGWGWLPFDPTPGQSGVGGRYSVSSKIFDAAGAAFVLAGKNGLEAFSRHASELGFARRKLRLTADVPRLATPTTSGSSHSRSPGLFRLLLLAVAGLAIAICVTKLVIRRGRYLTRDPRRLAAASGRELRDILVDQRVDVPPSATLQELAALVEAEFGFDATAFGLHASAARFGPAVGAREAAREMRRALRDVRRGIRVELTRLDRARGLLSLRSLGLA